MKSKYFSEDHDLFRESFRAFLEKEVRPNIDQWELDGQLPRDIYRKFGDMGYFGLTLPEHYGGSGLDIWYNVIFDEEIARSALSDSASDGPNFGDSFTVASFFGASLFGASLGWEPFSHSSSISK